MANTIRVLLVDDHGVLRAGLRALLDAETDIEVVGEAGTGEDGEKLAEQLKPDVVVMDLSMPGEGGLEATKRLAGRRGGPKVLVLTMHAEEDYLMPVLDACDPHGRARRGVPVSRSRGAPAQPLQGAPEREGSTRGADRS